MAGNENNLTIENASIMFPNFAGKAQKYNREGVRGFSVRLTPELADSLSRDGWNVKTTNVREDADGDPRGGEPHLPVAVRFDRKPPKVVLIASGKRTYLSEAEIDMLDYADITNVDVVISPYDWELDDGKTGRKAYLKSIFVTIYEDDMDRKYADIPVAGAVTDDE